MNYLNFLDGIRAIAVSAVVLYHLSNSFIPNGFLGVDVFFVVSGFIVSYAVANRKYSSFLGFISDFYARRFLRILPALLTCLLITALLTAIFIPEAWLSSSIETTGIFAIFGISNFFLSRGADYFSPVTEYNPFTHTWSLGVEEQFYFVFPIIFSFWALGYINKYISTVLYIVALAVSLAIYTHTYNSLPLISFYMVYTRFWELAAGVVCFQIIDVTRGNFNSPDANISSSRAVVASTAIGLLVVSLYAKFDPAYGWINNILAVVATVSLIASLFRQDLSRSFQLQILESGPVRLIGRISYSLYLWHWPVFVLARWTFGLDTPLQMTIALVIAVAAAFASYHFVEKPIRNARWAHITSPLVLISLGFVALFGTYLISGMLHTSKPSISASVVEANRKDWIPAHDVNAYKDTSECSIAASALDYGVSFRRNGCKAESVQKKVFALGDSHTGAYIPLFKRFTLQTGIETVVITTAGCPALSMQWSRDNSADCLNAVQKGFSAITREANKGDVVFLASLRLPRLAEQFSRFSDASAIEQVFGEHAKVERSRSIDQAVALLRPLSERGIKVVFEEPKPIFRSPPFRCSDWFNRSNPACKDGISIERHFIESLRKPTIDALKVVQKRLAGVKLWDPLPVLCPDKICETTRNGRPLYFDADHLSDYANFLVKDSFIGMILSTMNEENGLVEKGAEIKFDHVPSSGAARFHSHRDFR
ncbi:acyltransferase family protein [Brucella intermedia]|uniref:acyltransferase family protein n=1 Tax=Brucella intermedia TaxID=94625 RepID=UPI00224B0F3E|nr:acyltransferase family protein [Brucella intermedia]